MFDLPQGKPVDDSVDVGVEVMQMTFDYGVVSHFSGRRKTPFAYRLVCDGLVVGWLAEGEDKNCYIAGSEARTSLYVANESGKVSSSASEWTQAHFASIAAKLPESFPNMDLLGPLMPGHSTINALAGRDLAALAEDLASRAQVMGAFAFEDGMLLDSFGDLPGSATKLSTQAQDHLSGLEGMGDGLGMGSVLRTSIWLEGGVLLLAAAGSAALGMWSRHTADHQALLSNALALLDAGREVPDFSADTPLPEGFELKESKGGVDQVISMLKAASLARTSGYLSASKGETGAEVVIENGIPVGLRAGEGADFGSSVHQLTDPSSRLSLRRLDRVELLAALAGTIEGWTLGALCEELTTTRTKSENRKSILSTRLDDLFGFDVALETLSTGRAKWYLKESAEVGQVAKLPTVERGDEQALIEARGAIIEKLEGDLTASKKEAARLKRQTTSANKSADARADELLLANDRIAELRGEIEGLHSQIDTSKFTLREREVAEEEANARAAKLAKRATFLEHQLSDRASELAKAIGDADSSEALRSQLDELLAKEANLNADLESGAERLSGIRDQIEADERRQRLLTEQVSALRDRHRLAQAETQESEIRMADRRAEVEGLEAEAHSSRRIVEEHETRTSKSEIRAGQAQTELRELMEERRTLLRELGDMGARRGQAETELRTLVEQAERLSQAHHDAILDIEEAERIRARLAEEPLAQALLGEETSFQALGPVLDRLEHARDLGYTVTLLDRAVERGLLVIQHTVEQVAKTPRYLLSNEVMDLLERQAPETAGTVRGLTRWSVQQRLEHRLGETVSHVLLDLERLLEDFEQSITMLRRLRQVLSSLEGLGVPADEIYALQQSCNRPEALPQVSQGALNLIRQALDDIYLEADMRDAGAAVRLQETTQVLEELIDQIDTTGLSSGTPIGPLWDFQRTGLLPHEQVASDPPAPVYEDSLEEMNPVLGERKQAVATARREPSLAPTPSSDPAPTPPPSPSPAQVEEAEVVVAHMERVSDEPIWEQMPNPEDDPRPEGEMVMSITGMDGIPDSNELDERANLEEELARIDAARNRRTKVDETAEEEEAMDGEGSSALADLEADLADLDF